MASVAAALAFALRFRGRKRVHNADEFMADIVARRLDEHLAWAGFVVMRNRLSPEAPRSGADLRADLADDDLPR